MTTISKTTKNDSGKEITVNLTINVNSVNGTVMVKGGGTYTVTGIAHINGRKCLKINGAPAPYMPAAELYNEINAICKAQFAITMTPKDILETEVAKAEYKYNQAMRESWDNEAIIEAYDEWKRLSAELAKLD